jgi:hypothetical protein
MIRKLQSILLFGILLSSALFVVKLPTASAFSEEAEVYIVCLSDVGSWWVDNKSKALEGGIDAISVTKTEDYYDKYNIASVHPKIGNTPPFSRISYKVVSDWNTYKNIVESYKDIVVVNTHGEIIPVPSEYGGLSWLDEVAEAMLSRGVKWVNIAGYPFYYGWRQGATDKEEWGASGFQQVFSHININITLEHLPGSERDILSGEAEMALDFWKIEEGSYKVTRDRPLPASVFRDYLILPIWGDRPNDYYTGAVVAFVKPNERFSPNARNFGCFVHVGTSRTFTEGGEEKDKDYYRAYVGVAAAVWTTTTGFEGVTKSSRYDPGDVNFTIHATPTILEYKYWDLSDYWEIHLGFFILGGLKRPYWSSIDINNIGLYVKPEIPTQEGNSISLQPFPDLTRNAHQDFSEQLMDATNGIMLKSLLYGFSWFDPTQISKVFSGVMLFSDLLSPINYQDYSQQPTELNLEFFVDTYTTSEGYYDIIEFQSVFAINLRIYQATDLGLREGWRIIPIHWGVKLWPTAPAEFSGPVTGDNIELAVHFGRSEEYTPTVLFDDFEEETWRYERSDLNPDSGYDYWGITSYNYSFDYSPPFPAGNCFWCASAGDNSIHNKPNLDAGRYDKNMNAYLKSYIDLKPYKTAWLIYCVAVWWICQDDYFELYVKNINGAWTLADSITSTTTKHWRIVPLQNTINSIKFVFKSNSDNNVDIGACIYYIEIRATIPNDADTNSDAGDTISYATFIGAPPHSFSGYLDDEDWYIINNTSYATCQFALSSPLNTLFYIELYDMTDQKIAGPAQSIQRSLSRGLYKIRLYSDVGFGQYNLITTYPIEEGGGGGGRPPKLLGGEFK